MRAVETTIMIEATPQRVWEVLTDFEQYPKWSSFIKEVGGTKVVGSTLRVILAPAGRNTTTVRPRVSALEPNRRFAWTGHLLHPTVFSGTHEFLLESRPGGTRVTHTERFRGVLPSLIRNSPKGVEEAFAAFNQALKTKAESEHDKNLKG